MLDSQSGLSVERKTGRKLYLEFLRIIAIFMVLFNHTNTNGFILFTIARDSKLYWLYMFVSILIKIAVPIFFMISGALLFSKKESYREILKNRVLRIFVILIIASGIGYYYNIIRREGQSLTVLEFIKQMYSCQISFALWYMYAYLSFLIMLPLLKKLVAKMNKDDYKWIFVTYAAVQVAVIVEYIIWKGNVVHNDFFSLFYMATPVFFPIMGYYIDEVLKESDFSIKRLIILSATSVVAIIICCVMTNYKCTITRDWSEASCQTFFDTLIFLPSITVFYAAKYLFMRHKPNEILQKAIVVAGGTTFGIFLIEQICRKETMPVFYFLRPYIHSMPACCVWILCACIFGGCIVIVLKKVPFIRKYL